MSALLQDGQLHALRLEIATMRDSLTLAEAQAIRTNGVLSELAQARDEIKALRALSEVTRQQQVRDAITPCGAAPRFSLPGRSLLHFRQR